MKLAALGARPRRLVLTGVEALTASELRVAQIAAERQTNREIAQALLVTQKTVETHLHVAYKRHGMTIKDGRPERLSHQSAFLMRTLPCSRSTTASQRKAA